MFGNLGEMAKMMQKAKDIQKNMKAMKEEMASAEFTGAAPGNVVSATASGDFRIKSITITGDAPADRELLADLIHVAVNNALDASRGAMQQKMTEITGGLNLPGLF